MESEGSLVEFEEQRSEVIMEFANDTWCQEMNESAIIERNMTMACRNVLAGPPLPSTFMAIIQVKLCCSSICFTCVSNICTPYSTISLFAQALLTSLSSLLCCFRSNNSSTDLVGYAS